MTWKQSKMLVVDTETTSKYPTEAAIIEDRKAPAGAHPARVIQLGTCTVDPEGDGYALKHGAVWTNPGRNVPEDVVEAIHLKPEELEAIRRAAPFGKWAKHLVGSMEARGVVVGHNILNYDRSVLEREFSLCAVAFPDVLVIDTMVWARHLFDGTEDFRLETLAGALGVLGESHRAGEDCLMTWHILKHLMPEMPDDRAELVRVQDYLRGFGAFWSPRKDAPPVLNCRSKTIPRGTSITEAARMDSGFVRWTLTRMEGEALKHCNSFLKGTR